MNTTPVLTDIENNIGKIYLVSNRTHGYYTIMPLVEADFLSFLEELYCDIEVDDYEISYKYLIDVNLKNKIISYLHNIFKSTTLTFAINNTTNSAVLDFSSTGHRVSAVSAVNKNYSNGVRFHQVQNIGHEEGIQFPGSYIDKIGVAVDSATADTTVVNMACARASVDAYELDVARLPMPAVVNTGNKMNTSDDFFINLNQLLVNHIRNDELLKNFKLLEITDVCKASAPIVVEALEVVEPLIDAVKDKEPILPYNHYEAFKMNTGDTISASLDTTIKPIQYSSVKTDEFKPNPDIFNKCAVLYCVSQSIGIVIENQNIIFVDYLIKNFKDFELVKSYSKLDKKELDNIKNYFHKKNFENNETIFKKINSFEFLFDINNDKKNDKVYNEIEEFIRERYIIDNQPKNMIKANEILEQIFLELQYCYKDKLKLTKELSSILINMGLKKKRMSDGIYYCGIVTKHNLCKHNLFLSTSGNIEEMYKKTVEEHKLESISEILKRLKFSCKSRNEPCQCLDVKACDRVVVPKSIIPPENDHQIDI